MGKSQRLKGANGEREVAAILSEYLDIDIRRKLGQARDSGNDIDLGPFTVEVKRRKRIGGLYEWLTQTPAQTPVLMLRADGKQWLVTLYLTDFIRLAREEIVEANRR